MKILFLLPHPPYPANSGNKIAIYNTAKSFVKNGHSIDILSFYCGREKEFFDDPENLFDNAYFVKLPNLWKRVLASVFMCKSAVFYRFFSLSYLDKLRSIAHQYDCIYAHHTYMGQYLHLIPGYRKKKVLDIDVLEYNVLRREMELVGILKKIFIYFEIKKLRRTELICIKTLPISFSYGDIETEFLRKLECDKVFYRPLGLSVREKFFNTGKEDVNTLLFFGDYKWFPNYSAISYILRTVFPFLKEQLPDLILQVVGRNADPKIKKLCQQDGVTFVGEVDVVEPYILKSGFILSPMLIGGGVRLKILESLAHGKIVLTNTVGAEGIIDKSVLVVGDGNKELLNRLLPLYHSTALREQTKIKAREYFLKHHSLDASHEVMFGHLNRIYND